MASPLRRRRPTTAPGRSSRARTAASLLLGLWLAAGAWAQPPAQPTPAPARPPRTRDDVGPGFRIPLELPGFQRLFDRLDSEAAVFERMKQEARESTPPERLTFPEE